MALFVFDHRREKGADRRFVAARDPRERALHRGTLADARITKGVHREASERQWARRPLRGGIHQRTRSDAVTRVGAREREGRAGVFDLVEGGPLRLRDQIDRGPERDELEGPPRERRHRGMLEEGVVGPSLREPLA